MTLLFYKQRPDRGDKAPHVQNEAAKNLIWLRGKMLLCLSVDLQQIECALTHNVNDLYVTVDHRHILIVHGLIPSFRTPLILLCRYYYLLQIDISVL